MNGAGTGCWPSGRAQERDIAYISSDYTAAWKIRQANFPPVIEFIYPSGTLPVSCTGKDCSLRCAHCGGYYLGGMTPLNKARQRAEGKKSFLVSGGCNSQGKVPLIEALPEITKLFSYGELNLHTGLITDEREAEALGKIASVISLDFVADTNTIEEVYGLQATPRDYLKAYRILRRFTRVIPHICIGIKRGEIKGEYRALELLRHEGAEAISFLIFSPAPGTDYAACSPPSPEAVGHFLVTARMLFPQTPLYLGCMRPGGRYREAVDCLSIKAGMNKIVKPVPAAQNYARELGLEIVRKEECCAL